jgi:hypothetical protein
MVGVQLRHEGINNRKTTKAVTLQLPYSSIPHVAFRSENGKGYPHQVPCRMFSQSASLFLFLPFWPVKRFVTITTSTLFPIA